MTGAAPPGPRQTARGLLAWGDLEERRRRHARRGLAALPGWAVSAIAAALLGAELARRLGALGDPPDAAAASRLWIAAAVAGLSIAVFSAPFRLYWRRDSTLLARLAIPGEVVFRLAAARTARAVAAVLAPLVASALVFAAWGHAALAARHVALAAAAAIAAAGLGPASALFAGATVASDRALALLDSLGGEMRGPRTTWLGVLPGLAATVVALALIAGATWVAGAPGTAIGSPALLLALTALPAAAAFAAALAAAPRVALAALREVAALDQERLAHIEVTPPTALERAWARLTLSDAGRRVFDKDARLARRRYPGQYMVAAIAVLALWIGAAFGGGALPTWAAVTLVALAVYDVVFARRLAIPPVEHARFVATLPVAPSQLAAAKQQQVALRIMLTVVIGGAPLAARATDSVTVGALVLAAALVALVAGVWAGRVGG
jgi:hypothetical protein